MGCVDIEEVVDFFKSEGFRLEKVAGKKIIFSGYTESGSKVWVMLPQAKMQPGGFYWVDITSEQKNLLMSDDGGVYVWARLDNGEVAEISVALGSDMTSNKCMKYNAQEGNHWKLYIYPDKPASGEKYFGKQVTRKYKVQVVGGSDFYAMGFKL